MTMPIRYHSVFTSWKPVLLPNQQRQSTEGKSIDKSVQENDFCSFLNLLLYYSASDVKKKALLRSYDVKVILPEFKKNFLLSF